MEEDIRNNEESLKEEHLREELRKKSELLQQAEQLGRIGSWIFDVRNRTLIWSDEMHRIFGFEPGTFDGTLEQSNTRIHPDDLVRVRDTANAGIGSKTSYEVQYRVVHPDGSIRHILSHGLVRTDESGRPFQVIGTAQDITDHVLKDEALQRTATALRSLRESVIILDKDFIITYWNPACEEMYGIKADDALGKRIQDVSKITEDFPGQNDQFMEELVRDGFYESERYFSTTGGRRLLSMRVQAIEENGERTGWITLARDISDQKQAEEALQASEEKFSRIFHSSPDPIAISRLDNGTFMEVNESFIRSSGYSRKELIGRAAEELGFPSSETESTKIRKILQQKGSVRNLEISHRTKSGKVRDVLFSAEMITIEGIPSIITVTSDITERKKAEEELKNRNEYIQAILDNLPIGLAVNTIDDNVTRYVNNKFEEIYGWPKEDLASVDHFFHNVYPEDGYREPLMNKVFTDMESGDPERMKWEDLKATGKDGTQKIISAQNIPLLHQNLMISTVQDTTERKRAEEALKASEEQYRSLFETMAKGVVYQEADGTISHVNPAAERILGLSLEQMRGRDSADPRWISKKEDGSLFPGEEHPAMIALQTGKTVNGVIMSIFNPREEATRWIIIDSVPEFHPGEKQPYRIQTTFTDITEQKKAEEQLRYQASLVDNVTDAIISYDLDFRILSWNKAAETIYGWTEEEARGKDIRELISSDFGDTEIESVRLSMKESGSWKGEILQKTRNGSWINVLQSSISIGGDEKNPGYYIAIMADITAKKRAEEEIAKAARLESVGTLAGGIAHDFNNILTGIMGNISLAEMSIRDGDDNKAADRLAEAENASLRARDLTQQLLTFARGGLPVKQTITLGDLITDSVKFALRGSSVRPEFEIAADLLPVEADAGQMNQVITNLVLNAQEAMPEGGVIRVKAVNRSLDESSGLPLPPGNYVSFSVEDSGVGISEDHIDKLFEPYFTTKQRGSGLGLATTYSIVKNHEGHISIQSTPGKGSTFSVYLPASKQPAPSVKKKPENLTIAGKGRILVMDDEEAIRDLLRSALNGSGYETTVTSDGTEALAAFIRAREAGLPFSAVIMDLTVPGGMGGKELIEQLLQLDDSVKAIVSSGYATDPILANYREYGFSAVVTKPYSIRGVLKTLGDVLEQ